MTFKLTYGLGFEFAYEHGSVFLRIGKREWYYSQMSGFVTDSTPL